jgi:hypothetical protein
MKLPSWKMSELRDEFVARFDDAEINDLLAGAPQISGNALLRSRVLELLVYAERHGLTAQLLDAVLPEKDPNLQPAR